MQYQRIWVCCQVFQRRKLRAAKLAMNITKRGCLPYRNAAKRQWCFHRQRLNTIHGRVWQPFRSDACAVKLLVSRPEAALCWISISEGVYHRLPEDGFHCSLANLLDTKSMTATVMPRVTAPPCHFKKPLTVMDICPLDFRPWVDSWECNTEFVWNLVCCLNAKEQILYFVISHWSCAF